MLTLHSRFVDTEKWRKETDLDNTIATWDYPEKPEIQKYYRQFYHKTDNVCHWLDRTLSCSKWRRDEQRLTNSQDGRPIYIETLGGIDLTAMYKITTGERMLHNLAVEYERLSDPRLPACSRKVDNLVETCCTVMDLKGVTLTKVPSVYSYVKQASVISQNYYPERLGKLFLINAPWGFSTVWSVVKGWLDPVTVKKIHILGGGYKSELLKHVPAESLPKEFGGICECPGGCENADAGPWKDPKWARPAKWEQAAVTNEPSSVTKPDDDEKVAAVAPAEEGNTAAAAATA